MTVNEFKNEILRIKKEKNICIAAHTYQVQTVKEVADFCGDSFALSREAAKTDCESIIMCGVRFMAETAKLLSPEKRVMLSHPEAGCPMAEQFTREQILAMKKRFPDAAVVSYINTTNAIKSVSDVCVTSSSALKIISSLGVKEILFVPDRNLGSYIASMLPDIKVHLIAGGCPVHSKMTAGDVGRAKASHPSAPLLVHPECPPDVVNAADFVGSTSEIIAYAKSSPSKTFIIGTELSVAEQLGFELPDRHFWPLSGALVCPDMRLTTLPDVYGCLLGTHGEEIQLDPETAPGARRAIDRMLELGK